ncbi:hypothetical protein TNCV_539531 [Trichonephila clavipes]|nr:hypothetical protein TNCV_539531 [Trichonephila clavipes]
MYGGHGQWNETTVCLMTNPASACSITMVEFEFGDTVARSSCTGALCIATLVLHPVPWSGLIGPAVFNSPQGVTGPPIVVLEGWDNIYPRSQVTGCQDVLLFAGEKFKSCLMFVDLPGLISRVWLFPQLFSMTSSKFTHSSGCNTDSITPSSRGHRSSFLLILEVRLPPQTIPCIFEEGRKLR